MRFCGIDLHSNNSVVVVTGETDKVLLSRRCLNDLSRILALLAAHRDPISPPRFDLWPMRDLCGLQQKLDLHRIKRKDDLAGLCAAKHTSIQ